MRARKCGNKKNHYVRAKTSPNMQPRFGPIKFTEPEFVFLIKQNVQFSDVGIPEQKAIQNPSFFLWVYMNIPSATRIGHAFVCRLQGLRQLRQQLRRSCTQLPSI